jgi:hypothetical protein
MQRGAEISKDGCYRYRLWRRWEPGPNVVWIMLNPSTADAYEDDPTIRRCIGFSQTWGFGGLQVVNLYALRATDPEALRGHPEPEGPENSRAWEDVGCFTGHQTVIAAWGAKVARLRPPQVLSGKTTTGFQCLGMTGDGHPMHPLYVKANTPLVPFVPGATQPRRTAARPTNTASQRGTANVCPIHNLALPLTGQCDFCV